MPDLTTTMDDYLAAYGEPDATRRATLIAAAFAPDGRLIDPPLTGEDRDGISAMAATVQQQFAGHGCRRATAVDAHHNRARYAWELVAPDGEVALSGLDVVELAEDGRLRSVVGFFGELPAGETGDAGADR